MFVEALERYGGARLARGKTYANTGRVLSLEFDEGKAAAKVEGNYSPFYRVAIQFPALKEKEKVYQLIEEDPALLSAIASGELPHDFLTKLKKAGIALMPERWRDMKRTCTCPDDGDPCKHMAALYYIIAREIDADPRLLFRLRGMDLEKRFGAAIAASIEPPFKLSLRTSDAASPGAPPPLEELPPCAGLMLSLLPENPPFADKDFAYTLAEFYHFAERSALLAALPEESGRPLSKSRWNLKCESPGAKTTVIETDALGRRRTYSVAEAFALFLAASQPSGTPGYVFLFYLFRFLNLVVRSCAFAPFVFLREEKLRIVWLPYRGLPEAAETVEKLAALEPGMLSVKAGGKSAVLSGRSVVDLLSSAFLNDWISRLKYPQKARGGGRDFRALLDCFFANAAIDVSPPNRRSLPAAIDRWLSVLTLNFASPEQQDAFRYRFKVGENKSGYVLAMDVLARDGDQTRRTSLSQAALGAGDKTISLLRAPTALSNYLPEIRVLMKRASVTLPEERLAAFLEKAAPLLTRLGIEVELPKALSRELKPRLVVKTDAKGKGNLVSYLNMDSLLEFDWEIAVGDVRMSRQEFEALLKEKRDLVRFKDGFVRLKAEELARLLAQAKNEKPTVNDFLKARFAGDSDESPEAQKQLSLLFAEKNFPQPPALKAALRPYQERGYNWACSLLMAGFGCILADDMGLGKTVQAIAVMLRLRDEGLLANGCLVVAPAALLENWERELARFAPDVPVVRYHGAKRKIGGGDAGVFLTTYQTAARDAEKLAASAFSLLIIDEAHLIKNAGTAISKTVKNLNSAFRLALSGTPVENRLEDLRSLFDFIMPGYLGTAADFRNRFRYPIEVLRSAEVAEELRKISAPFLLRRLKTDKAIIRDLPEKVTGNEYALLEKEQALLYESLVSESLEKSERTDDPALRSALILQLLTGLKQICDHPRVYDKESPAVSSLSGKAKLLTALLAEVLSAGEKALVFSQYVETLDCLKKIIADEMGEAALVYHGGMSQKSRAAAVDAFQNDAACQIMLVSLRAGGLGLNLTAASRVIHYDLWYNPAVENQATDRAFRIGQKRNVFVHRFITKNTFEEKIDAMLAAKRELAEMTVASGESWLARMSHEELKALFGK